MHHFAGILFGITTIAGIWIGHVLVRKVEFTSADLRLPIYAFFTLGGGLVLISLFSTSNLISGVFGILGVIFLWNGIETGHQEKRVKRGHTPANPNNPRHRQILRNFPTATTENLLKHNHSIRPEKGS